MRLKEKLRRSVTGGPGTLRSVFLTREPRRSSYREQAIASLGVGTNNRNNREDWLTSTLATIPAGSRILDAGAGELQYKRFCEHLKYVSQDFAQYDGRGNGSGLQTDRWDNSMLDIVSDITAIPEVDGAFDAIMCVEVLEHVPRPLEALREFARLLRPSGDLIITTPVASLTHFAPYYFYNGYSRYFYETHLPKLGFEILELSHNGNFFEFVAQELIRTDTVARRYTSVSRHTRKDEWTTLEMLRRLRFLADHDEGSSELGSHGLHIKARRRAEPTNG